MAQKMIDKPLLQQFEVKGYKNLTRSVTFGPLGRINVIHGENNVGKSNLLQAMDLYFRLLASFCDFPIPDVAKASDWDYPGVSNFEKWGHPVGEIFNFVDPAYLEMTGTFAFTVEQRERFGLEQSQSLVRFGIRVSLQANAERSLKNFYKDQIGFVITNEQNN